MKSMVYKTLSIVLVVAVGMMVTIASHKQESQKKREIFDRNAAAVKALFQVFADRNLDARMDLLANDARYSPAQYTAFTTIKTTEKRSCCHCATDTMFLNISVRTTCHCVLCTSVSRTTSPTHPPTYPLTHSPTRQSGHRQSGR